MCKYIHKYKTHAHFPTLWQSDSVLYSLLPASAHTHTVSVSLYVHPLSAFSETHMSTHRCLKERKPTELEKRLFQDERLHTHCLHAEPLPTPSRDSAYCSRGLCYADTLQLASLPTPINAATHFHPLLSFTPFLSLPLCQWSSDTTVAAREQRGT